MVMDDLVFVLLITTGLSVPSGCFVEDDYEYFLKYYRDYIYTEDDSSAHLAEPKHIVAKEGESVFMSCLKLQWVYSYYIFTLTKIPDDTQTEELLYIGDRKMSPDHRYSMVDGIMMISAITPEDSGAFVCRVIHGIQEDEVKHTLEVRYQPRVIALPPEVRVLRGKSAHLRCVTDGDPTPTVFWSYEGGDLPSGTHEEGMTLRLEDVDYRMNGTYTCTAHNGIKGLVTVSVPVIVEFPPQIVTGKGVIRTVKEDEIELGCSVRAEPLANVTWSKAGQPVSLNTSVEAAEGKRYHSLRVTEDAGDDLGQYVCTAVNIHGNASATMNIEGMISPPRFTSDPHGSEGSSYTLTWETESYSHILSYRLRHRKATISNATGELEEWQDNMYLPEEVETRDLIHTLTHTLTGLTLATDYQAAVQVQNKFRWSVEATFNFSTYEGKSRAAAVDQILMVQLVPLLLLLLLLPLLVRI